jgi:deoxyhypusine synthase
MMSEKTPPRGRHILVDLSGYVSPGEDEGEWMLQQIRDAVTASPAREVHYHVETFDGHSTPRGFAAVVLIDESHVTAHCYSEEGLLAIDSFSCGQCDPQSIIDHLLGNLFEVIPTLEICSSEEVARFNTQSSADSEVVPVGVRQLLEQHYRHFNAGVLHDAAVSLSEFLDGDGRLLITLAGAMSTAEIGRSLAPMIRAGKIAAICTTGANLEEDVFNLVAFDHYMRIPNWRTLSAEDDEALREEGYNRVTDTAIPEEQAIRKLEAPVLAAWKAAEASGESKFPHQFLYDILLSGELADSYQAQARNSWLLAAAEANIPIFTPGWEDSTLGNIFAARIIDGSLSRPGIVKGGIEAMLALAEWYRGDERPAGILQVGGGIAGDFPICVVPMLRQDLGQDAELWSWFAQISESTASYGGYSGAPPEEKISWGKLAVDTPKFVIESDATIVLPLLFAAILDL